MTCVRQSLARQRRSELVTDTAAVVLLLLAVATAPVAAHAVNYTSMDPQRTGDGSVVIEAVYLEEPGWVTLYADGRPVGHAPVDHALTTVTDVRVPVTSWSGNDTLTVRPRLYADDGDGSFEPGEDRELVLFGTQSETTIARGKADAHVLAERAGPLELVDGAVPVRSVALPADGTVVVRTTDGDLVGSRTLPAGTQANVSVPVNRTLLPEEGSVSVVIALVVDGEPVTAGGDSVRSIVELSTDTPTTDTPASDVTTPSTTVSTTLSPDGRTDTGQPGLGVAAFVAALVAVGLARRAS